MPIDEKRAGAYLKKILKQVENNPDALDKYERRLAEKQIQAVTNSNNAERNIENLRNQIRQAEARINSLLNVAADNKAKAEAFAESLVAFKFQDELDEPSEPSDPGEETDTKEPTGKKEATVTEIKAKTAKKKSRGKPNSKSSATA